MMTGGIYTLISGRRFDRLLKNYCACQYSVKIRLKMLIYRYKLRYFAEFCLVLTALITFFSNLLVTQEKMQS